MKKAQGLPMNVIIIAALALLVLVILTIVFMGRINIFGKETGTCTKNPNARCMAPEDCDPDLDGPSNYMLYSSGGNCDDDAKTCCIKKL